MNIFNFIFMQSDVTNLVDSASMQTPEVTEIRVWEIIVESQSWYILIPLSMYLLSDF